MKDAIFDLCLDQTHGRWVPRLTLPRIAIYSSTCPPFGLNLTDLENGCIPDKLNELVLNEDDYEDLVWDLKNIWIPGPYAPENLNRRPKKYWFSEGVYVHESYHENLFREKIKSMMENAFKKIFDLSYPQTQYPCVRDVRGLAEINAIDITTKAFSEISTRYKDLEEEQITEERDADEHARPFYEIMLDCVTWWGNTKGWE